MSQTYGITIINGFLTALFSQYLKLPIETTMLKLLSLAPSIENCHKNVYKSETVWATHECRTFLESWEQKQSAGIHNKAVGYIVKPEFKFKVRRI